MPRLTRKQLAVFDLIVRSTRYYWSGPSLHKHLGQSTTEVFDSSVEGVHATAASLVRRGLLVKSRINGIVQYSVAPPQTMPAGERDGLPVDLRRRLVSVFEKL